MLASVTHTNEAWVCVFSEREAKTKIPNEENKHNTVLIDNLVCNQTRVWQNGGGGGVGGRVVNEMKQQ